ncbi:hypothetical protein [Flaviaesturariibacter amylovorans]|uniref:Outer membrane protein beta-barrel domain-containing protein n=1 Tax=Flaviaesturariibacter amylovorans TaxID=1084520 RepID=A0ABP8GFW2_9BACT
MKPFPKHRASTRWLLLLLAALSGAQALAQDTLPHDLKYITFPLAPQRPWTVGVGITATTMPYEVTEEFHYQVPAVEVQALRRLGAGFSLQGRASLQVFQNYFSIGPRWSARITDRISAGVGNDVAFWFGSVNVEGFRTRATGWQNFPNVSVGYRFGRQVLLTLRAESIMTLDISPRAGDIKIRDDYRLFSGSAYTLLLEQPFYGRNKRLALGLRGIYTSSFWQTWSIFSALDRNYFYPQFIACLIL